MIRLPFFSALKNNDGDQWVAGFTAGFSKAWDCMWPQLQQGIDKTKQSLYQSALDEAVRRLEPAIQQRVDAAEHTTLKAGAVLVAKEREWTLARDRSTGKDRDRWAHYLSAYKELVDGGLLQTHQPESR